MNIDTEKLGIRYFNQLDHRTAINIYKKATILADTYIDLLSLKSICHLSIRDIADISNDSYKKISSNIHRAKLLILAAIRKYIPISQYTVQMDVEIMYKEILVIYFYDLYGWNKNFSLSCQSLLSKDETEYYEHHIDEMLSAYSD